MRRRISKLSLCLMAPVALAACQGSTTSNVTPVVTPAVTAAVTPSTATTPTATTPATMTTVTATPVTGTSDGFQTNPVNDASFATLINGVRATNGANPVTYNALLDVAAQAHSDDMLARDYFAHNSPEGTTVGQRVTAAGYNWRTVGENIAQGQATEQIALDGWVASPGHQANNVNPAFTEFGLGRAGSGSDVRWTLVFAAPQ